MTRQGPHLTSSSKWVGEPAYDYDQPVEQEDHIGPASHTIKQLVADLFVERTLKIVMFIMVLLMMMMMIIMMTSALSLLLSWW